MPWTPPPRAPCPACSASITAADLTDVGPIPGGIGFPRPDGGPSAKTDRTLLASNRVRFVGEPVALVVAETKGAALEAADAVLVDYHELPVVTDADRRHAARRTRRLGRGSPTISASCGSVATPTAPSKRCATPRT